MFDMELKKVAVKIDGILRKDDFPGKITPPFLKNAVRDYPLRKGKRLRPALLLWSCGLAEGNPESAKFAAAAAEIYHNWTLVHDDIIDNDSLRRGLPSTHISLANFAKKEFRQNEAESSISGRNFAILAGDIQQGWAVHSLLKSQEAGVSCELTLLLCRKLQELVNRELISGEAIDVALAMTDWAKTSPATVERMLYLKTGSLLRFCAESGMLIGLGSAKFANDPRVRKIGEFAALCGIAFQLRDDWLGIYGDEEKLGKPVGSDLSENKPTLLLLHAWRNSSILERRKIISLLGKASYSKSEIEYFRNIVRSSGAEKKTMDKAMKLANSAKEILLSFPDNKYRQLLSEWADYVLGRNK